MGGPLQNSTVRLGPIPLTVIRTLTPGSIKAVKDRVVVAKALSICAYILQERSSSGTCAIAEIDSFRMVNLVGRIAIMDDEDAHAALEEALGRDDMQIAS